MDEVLKLVNRLQSACTLLGDTAGQKDADLPGLWEMLPSIVVIGGQVTSLAGSLLFACCSVRSEQPCKQGDAAKAHPQELPAMQGTV